MGSIKGSFFKNRLGGGVCEFHGETNLAAVAVVDVPLRDVFLQPEVLRPIGREVEHFNHFDAVQGQMTDVVITIELADQVETVLLLNKPQRGNGAFLTFAVDVLILNVKLRVAIKTFANTFKIRVRILGGISEIESGTNATFCIQALCRAEVPSSLSDRLAESNRGARVFMIEVGS